MSDNSSSIGSVDGLDEDDVDLSQFGLSAPQSVTPVQKPLAHSPKPKLTLICGLLPSLALLSRTVLFAPAPTTARSTVLAQTRQDSSPQNGPVCFRFNRTSGCTSSTCLFPHICLRCRSAAHSIVNCPNSMSRTTQRHHSSISSGERSKR